MEVKRGYKRTEVGIIPEDWELVTLDKLGNFSKGKGIRKDQVRVDGIPCVRYGELYTRHNEYIRDFYSYISPTVAKQSQRLKRGDLLFAGSGETAEEIGKCAAFLGDKEAYAGGDIVIFSPVGHDSMFLGYLMNYPSIVEQRSRMGQGDAVVHISARNLGALRFGLPKPQEQRTIAAALRDVDDLIAALEKLITKKRDLKQAAMQQLLTGRQRLPGFHGAWEPKLLRDVSDIDSDNLSADTPPDYAFNYISLEDVDTGSLRRYSEQVFRSAPSRARRRVRKEDILVSTVRPNLKSHLLFAKDEPNWICSTGFSVVRCKIRVANPAYVFFHLFGDSVVKQIETLLTGSNYPAISGRDVKALRIPMPAFDEQTAIAAVLSDMDAEIAALNARLVKTRALKQGMMQELLTGRTRLV